MKYFIFFVVLILAANTIGDIAEYSDDLKRIDNLLLQVDSLKHKIDSISVKTNKFLIDIELKKVGDNDKSKD